LEDLDKFVQVLQQELSRTEKFLATTTCKENNHHTKRLRRAAMTSFIIARMQPIILACRSTIKLRQPTTTPSPPVVLHNLTYTKSPLSTATTSSEPPPKKICL